MISIKLLYTINLRDKNLYWRLPTVAHTKPIHMDILVACMNKYFNVYVRTLRGRAHECAIACMGVFVFAYAWTCAHACVRVYIVVRAGVSVHECAATSMHARASVLE